MPGWADWKSLITSCQILRGAGSEAFEFTTSVPAQAGTAGNPRQMTTRDQRIACRIPRRNVIQYAWRRPGPRHSVEAGVLAGDRTKLSSPHRLQALLCTGLVSEAMVETFDRIAGFACKLLNTPTALVSVLDDTRQIIKGAHGLE